MKGTSHWFSSPLCRLGLMRVLGLCHEGTVAWHTHLQPDAGCCATSSSESASEPGFPWIIGFEEVFSKRCHVIWVGYTQKKYLVGGVMDVLPMCERWGYVAGKVQPSSEGVDASSSKAVAPVESRVSPSICSPADSKSE